MPRLVACRHCNIHVKPHEPRCPHCGVALASSISATVIVGLALAGCTPTEPPPKPKAPPAEVKKTPDDDKKSEPILEPEVEYGVPFHDEHLAPPAYGMPDPPPQDDEKKSPTKK